MYPQLIPPFTINSFKVMDTGKGYTPPLEAEREVQQIWTEAQTEYGKELWNGVNYRFEKFDDATIFLGECEYRYNYCSNRSTQLKNLPLDRQPKCLFISATLKTADNYFIFGETASSSIHGTTVTLLGGSLNKDEHIVSVLNDLFEYITVEIHEETSLPTDSFNVTKGYGAFLMPSTRIGIMMQIDISLTKEQCVQNIRLSNEHSKFIYYAAEELLSESFSTDHLQPAAKLARILISEGL